MGVSSSSSSDSLVEANSANVYVSFSLLDLPKSFSEHLVASLTEGGIEYCMEFYEDEYCMEFYEDNTFKKIENSKIALVVLSERYTYLTSCLYELVKIMENVEDNKLIVIPIFYKVKVKDVKYFRGVFGKILYRVGFYDQLNVPKWEYALKSIAATEGFTSADYSTERELIVNIVLKIKKIIAQLSPEGNNSIRKCSTMSVSSSSSSDSLVKANSADVYLNLPWLDVTESFYDHLTTSLRAGGIEYCIDFREDNTLKKIDNSKIALVVLSEQYAYLNSCLNELVKIMENVEDNKLIVIPIFYKVKVEDVEYFTGNFGKNLYRGGDLDQSNIPKWKYALKSIAATEGLTSVDYSTERDLIVNIVLEIKKMLAQLSPVREVEEGNNMFSTASSSSNILSGTIDQQQKQLEEKLDFKWTESPTVDDNISISHPHQVFISFRGEQLRYNFISHLVGALRRKGVNVFIDTQENKGEDISNLLKRIEESRIAIVVFSSRYTESKWCLREAETIMKRAAHGKLKVLPIFYKVTPTNVKQLKGEFGDNFRDREREYRNDESLIKKWKKALAYIAGKIGIEVNDRSDENDSITSIVNEVIRMLTSIPLDTQTASSRVDWLFGLAFWIEERIFSKDASCGISSTEPPPIVTSIPLDTQTASSLVDWLFGLAFWIEERLSSKDASCGISSTEPPPIVTLARHR